MMDEYSVLRDRAVLAMLHMIVANQGTILALLSENVNEESRKEFYDSAVKMRDTEMDEYLKLVNQK